jgi:hypothetical protein
MMTNIIAQLHTTLAYQSAVVQLMVGQANFDAQQLHLQEPLPIAIPANANNWRVAMPPDGVTGWLTTSNYIYRFNAGRLILIQKRPQPRGAGGAASEPPPSLIDAGGAFQLATQWLAGISVDVAALESQYPHRVVSLGANAPAGRERVRAGVTNRVIHPTASAGNRNRHTMPPLFEVTWGGGHSAQTPARATPIQIIIDILGSTKQCTALHVLNPEWFRQPPLQVTNAAALLGPPPPPQHFVEAFLGGRAAYDAVAKPERVTAWLLSRQTDEADSKTNRTPAVPVEANTAALFSKALTDFNSYSWLEEKTCNPDYGVRLRFTKGADNVDFLLCFDCDHLQVTHNGETAEKDFDAARPALVQAMQTVFPRDEVIKNLALLPPAQTN